MSLTNAQYDAIMRIYDKRQTENHHIWLERRREAFEAIPQLAEIDRSVAMNALEKVRRNLFPAAAAEKAQAGVAEAPILKQEGTDDTGAGALRKGSVDDAGVLRQKDVHDAGALRQEGTVFAGAGALRRKLLKEHGFPEDYLDPVYSCPLCRDSGLVNGKHCRCFDREVIRLFYTQSGLSSVLEKENFDHLSMKYYPADLIDPVSGRSSRMIMEKAVSDCRRFCSHYDEEPGFLLLTGLPGLGKTFLSHCIARELIESGHSVIYYSAGKLFDSLADAQFRRESTEPENAVDMNYLTGCDLLIIDDLGTELSNAFTSSAFFRLLNERMAENKGMVISTNLPMSDLKNLYSERIVSRIIERFTLISLFGKDIRVQKRIG